uniref:GST N-terminal domain-containing protein n=2 Tax=Bursaphelenchus xylophilus TaxID=6326 RepID=A0A1I7S9Z2_BURXY
MVILRTERVFCQSGKDKFSECFLSISFDTTGPNFTLFKDKAAKKQLLETIDLKKSAEQIRFGSTARPYGNLPIIRKDKRLDADNFIVFQVERIVRKSREPRLVWLCASSAKQMFGILKIFATCLTYLSIPAPERNVDVDDPNSLAKYKPHLLNPANNWERFWENPPPARLLTALELARAMTKSLDAVHRVEKVVVDNRDDRKKIQKTTIREAQAQPPRASSWKRGSTSSGGTTSK